MVSVDDANVFPLLHLPVELIVEVTIWAQVMWQEDTLPMHGPHVGVKRLATAAPETRPRVERCVGHVDRSVIPQCWTTSIPEAARSPAHSMVQTCQRLRNALLGDDSRVWRLDNALYKSIAERSGVRRLLAENITPIEYGARSLVALNACACLVRGIEPFYLKLQNIRVAMASDETGLNSEDFFIQSHDELLSPLQHFDLEIYEAPRSPTRPLIRAIPSASILRSRAANISYFLYSAQLTSLDLYQPHARRPRFGASFWSGLGACAAQLEYLTIDAASGSFVSLADVLDFPKLRYVRLVLPVREGPTFLRSLRLPATLDIHLEPVVDWRTSSTVQMAGRRPQPHDVPFAAMEAAADASSHPYALWRYVSALATPHETSGIFRNPPHFSVQEAGLWHTVSAVGLDIRLDPATTSLERACRRFPEFVGIVFAGSLAEIDVLLADPGRDWRHAETELRNKRTVRRSLGVRDGMVKAADRERSFRPQLSIPVYESVHHISTAAVASKPGSAYSGAPHIRTLVIGGDAWLPAFSLGWRYILEPFSTVTDLVIRCLCVEEQLPENAEGCLTPARRQALAAFLNDFATRSVHPCPDLRRIHLRYADHALLPRDLAMHLEAAFNAKARAAAGAHHINVVITVCRDKYPII